MPSGPSSRTAPATARSTSAHPLTSATSESARPPSAVIAAAVSFAPLPERSTTATGVPAFASATAIARPMPEPPPVTIAQPGTRSLMSLLRSPEERRDGVGDLLRGLVQQHVPAGKLLELGAPDLLLPLIGVRERVGAVLGSPQQERRRRDAVQALHQALVGDRPDELRHRGAALERLRQRRDVVRIHVW